MTTQTSAGLTPRAVDEHVAYIAARVSQLGTGPSDLASFAEVGERFLLLRRQYQLDPQPLNGNLPRLAQLRRQFDALLDARQTQVVDRYHQVSEQLRRAEREREFLREVLIRQAGDAPLRNLNGTAAEVTVRAARSRLLPGAGTTSRAELERLVQEAGKWQQASSLSRVKLQRIVDDSGFPATHQQVLDRLFPVTTVHQVTSHARGA